jgi:outer membrane lipoprotein SlyB
VVKEQAMDSVGAGRAAAAIVALVAALVVSACAPAPVGDSYYAGQVMRAQSVELGVVEGLRPVVIEGWPSGAGAATGAVLGGVGGYQVGGSSSANAAGAFLGAIIGSLIGNAMEREATKTNGVEITVRLDSGRMLAVVQEGPVDAFRPGDRIRVLSDGYMTRVAR